jgi:hypothetical protein
MDASRVPEEFPAVPLPIAKDAAPRREMPVSEAPLGDNVLNHSRTNPGKIAKFISDVFLLSTPVVAAQKRNTSVVDV